ncbi:hypothetical protein [Clostridium sp.]|nr:hypothetical protein [Clostridium sp.]MBK5241559.1 hypothetical protein [Clostridium sp.]
MKIYYPTYYLVPVVPVMSLDDEDYNDRYRDINTNIFADIDEEYVNESTK